MPQVNPIVRAGLQERATKLILAGKTNADIAKELNVNEGAVKGLKRKVLKTPKLPEIMQTDGLKAQITIELTRELADLKLGKLLSECEDNYDKAKGAGNQQLAGSWAIQWGAALDKLLKVTGRYNVPMEKQEPLKVIFEDA